MMGSASVADEVAEVVPAYAIELQGPHLTNVHCPEDNLSITSSSRTPLNQVAALTQAELTNPNLFLSLAIANQTMLGTMVLIVSTHTKILISASDVGRGIDNIASRRQAAGPARFPPSGDCTAIGTTPQIGPPWP